MYENNSLLLYSPAFCMIHGSDSWWVIVWHDLMDGQVGTQWSANQPSIVGVIAVLLHVWPGNGCAGQYLAYGMWMDVWIKNNNGHGMYGLLRSYVYEKKKIMWSSINRQSNIY